MADDFSEVFEYFESQEKSYQYFCSRIVALVSDNPELEVAGMQSVHSVKSRKKSRASIIDKCTRKKEKGVVVNGGNAADHIEDFFGIRLLHLHFDQLATIHSFLKAKAEAGEFTFGEAPKAYTWDPEYKDVLEGLGFDVEFKESFYTSVHYILRADNDSPIRCELQVRTLFEETWGELDHWMNYPHNTENLALREQLLVLSRVVTAGSRLAVSINRIHMNSSDQDPA